MSWSILCGFGHHGVCGVIFFSNIVIVVLGIDLGYRMAIYR